MWRSERIVQTYILHIKLNNKPLVSLKSFDHLWSNQHKIKPADLYQRKSSLLSFGLICPKLWQQPYLKYTCISSVLTNTHQFPARNHRPTELWHTSKHLPPVIIQICSSCVIASQRSPVLWFVVHGGQLFLYWQNLFKPKLQSLSRIPKWYLRQITAFGNWLNRQLNNIGISKAANCSL